MQNFIVIAVFLALGALSRRLFSLPEKAPLYINHFIISVTLPAVILLKLPQLPLNRSVLLPMLIPWLSALPLTALVFWLAKRFGWLRDKTGAVVMLVLYGNTSYLGFPLVRALFGDAGMPYAIIFDQLGNFTMLAITAPLIIAHFGEREKPLSAALVARRVFSFPPFLALLVALALNGATYPAWLTQVLSWLSMLLAPLAMFIVGLQISWRVPGHLQQPLVAVLGIRLLAAPLLALLLCLISGHTGLAARVSVLEAAMPTMVTAGLMAMAANLVPRLCTAAVGFTLCGSLLTLPLWYVLTQWLFH